MAVYCLHNFLWK